MPEEHGEHGFLGRKAFEQPKLESVVETCGVADVFLQNGEPGAHRQPRTNFALFGAEPAPVRDDSIDLTVMRDVTKGLRQMPGGLRVRRVALVKTGERGRKC